MPAAKPPWKRIWCARWDGFPCPAPGGQSWKERSGARAWPASGSGEPGLDRLPSRCILGPGSLEPMAWPLGTARGHRAAAPVLQLHSHSGRVGRGQELPRPPPRPRTLSSQPHPTAHIITSTRGCVPLASDGIPMHDAGHVPQGHPLRLRPLARGAAAAVLAAAGLQSPRL